MITAGIHGNEIGAPLAARKFPEIQLKKGILVVIPVVNRQAFRSGTRGKPDINRTFPRTFNEPSRHPLAGQLLHLAKQYRPTMCLDLHEGWGFHQRSKAAFGQTFITNPTSPLRPLIHQVINRVNGSIQKKKHQFTTRFSVLPGSFRTAMTKILRIPTVTIETSVSLSLPVRVQYQEAIVHHFLDEVGLI
jgi:predicted deacylase